MTHELKIRVYYHDTDDAGVVWHPNYIGFGSRARVDWMRQQGMSIAALKEQGFYFPVVTVNVQYHKPAVLDDLLIVKTQVLQRKKVSIVFKQQVVKANAPEDVLCDLETKVGCVDAKTHKPMPIPKGLFELEVK